MGGLLCFRVGMILASFHNVGILLCMIEKLNMSERALMACVPNCLDAGSRCYQDPWRTCFLC